MATTTANTATTMSPPNDSAPDTSSFTYGHDEVQQLLEDARLDRWEARFEEGQRTGRKTGHEEGKEGHNEGYEYGYDTCRQVSEPRQEEAHKKGLLEGHELGLQQGKDQE